jgi:demethylmenaquinone methyltransferase/2-methoxy-6-polyprenyl-1,4-benzoquinol methylase
VVREALDPRKLTLVYDRVSRRYDFQHSFFTAGSDQRGRRLLVEKTVKPGDRVLDCGAGTGSTSLMAARSVGPTGKVTLFDISEGMLAVAKQKAANGGLLDQLAFQTGDCSLSDLINR